MISLYDSTDATATYRESSALQTVKLDCTADTGSLMGIMRDAVLVIGSPAQHHVELRTPLSPFGDIDAVSK